MGPRTGLDSCPNLASHRDSIPGPSSPQPVAIPTELPGPCRGLCFCLTGWFPCNGGGSPHSGMPNLFLFCFDVSAAHGVSFGDRKVECGRRGSVLVLLAVTSGIVLQTP
jgi:hypothetical protein